MKIASNNFKSDKIAWFIAILAGTIRILASVLQPAYIDEAYNQYLCQAGPRAIVELMKLDNHTPLLQLALYPLSKLTDNIFFMRLPEVIFSLGTIAISHRIFRTYLDKNTSLWLTLFISINYPIWISDAQFRPYAPLTFGLSALWWGMFSVLQNRAPFTEDSNSNTTRKWLLFSLVCLLCGSIHFLGVISLFICSLTVAIIYFNRQSSNPNSNNTSEFSYRQSNKIYIISILCLWIGWLPGLCWFIWSRLNRPLFSTISISSYGEHIITFLSAPLHILGWDLGDWGALLDPIKHSQILNLIPLTSLLLNIIAWLYIWRGVLKYKKVERLKKGDLVTFLALNAIGPIFIICLAGLIGAVNLAQARYSVPFSVPILVLLLGGMGAKMRRFIVGASIGTATIICLLFPFCPSLWNQYWQGTIEAIDAEKKSGDMIAVYTPYSVYSFAKAYNPQGIRYVYQDPPHLSIQQSFSRGKLLIFALEPWMLDENIIYGPLNGKRIFLVLVQSNTFDGESTVQWLHKYYNFTELYNLRSIQGWATTKLYMLTPSTSSKQDKNS